jgi:hypothetical protein
MKPLHASQLKIDGTLGEHAHRAHPYLEHLKPRRIGQAKMGLL